MDRYSPDAARQGQGTGVPGPDSLGELLAWVRRRDQPAALRSLAQAVVPGQTGPGDTIRAVVWATPDIARSIEPVAAPFRPAERDRLLEGRSVLVRLGRVDVLVEQPEMAGGLAAYVSRYGEGMAALYLDRPRFVPHAGSHRRPPRPMRTPLVRRAWLLPHEWPWGPFVIALEPVG